MSNKLQAMFRLIDSRCLEIKVLLLTSLFAAGSAHAKLATPASVVDYLDSISLDSSYANRKALFTSHWPGEEYRGSAEQNQRLLKHLIGSRKQTLIPFPSESIDKCESFYSDKTVSRYVTEAFLKNAITACIVTGASKPSKTIRIKLQEFYLKATPSDGKTFTYKEHKEIHDKAYRAAGCTEGESARIEGWLIVNSFAISDDDIRGKAILEAITTFGPCTISGDQ